MAGLLVMSSRFTFSLGDIVTITAVSFFGSLALNRLSARLGIKDSPW